MPVGWIARVCGVIDDGDVDEVSAGVAGEGAPGSAGGPDGAALDIFAG